MKVIRGESPSGEFHASPKDSRDSGEVLIDTLSLTLPIASVHELYPENGAGLSHSPLDAVFAFVRELLPFSLEDVGQGKNNFQFSRSFADGCGFVAWGGNDTVPLPDGTIKHVPARFQVYVTGAGCLQVTDWGRVADLLSSFADLRITRLDIACDDHEGHRSVDYARNLFHAGAFTTSGRPPKANFIDDMGQGHGCTLYVGNRAHGKLLRVYEKGRQLGDRSSPWVRWEIEFKNKHRVIPLDALRRPAEFLAGAYPALHWVSKIREVVRTVREKADVTVTHLVNCARTAYGKLFSFLQSKGGFTAEEIFNSLGISGGTPKRLAWANQFNTEDLQLCLT